MTVMSCYSLKLEGSCAHTDINESTETLSTVVCDLWTNMGPARHCRELCVRREARLRSDACEQQGLQPNRTDAQKQKERERNAPAGWDEEASSKAQVI